MHLNNTPLSMLLRVLLLGMAVLVSRTATAEGSFLLDPDFDALKNGSVMLAPVGQRGAGIRMVFQVAGHDATLFSEMNNSEIWQLNEGASAVFLSLVIPW